MEEAKEATTCKLDAPISEEQLAQIRASLDATLDGELVSQMLACVQCGLCADSCHYYLTKPETEAIPAYKAALVTSFYKSRHTLVGKLLPSLSGARPLDAGRASEWVDSLFGRCSLCGRCTINCTMGIGIHQVIRRGRSALAAAGLVPSSLQATVDKAVISGNNMGISKEEWLDTIAWLTEELQGETGDPTAELPLDKTGVDYLYAINPREAKFYPLSLLAAGKIFYAAGASWTFASDNYDITNYGLFNGDDEKAALIADRLQITAKRLGAMTIVLGECGHGFNANFWEGPEWRKQPHEVPEMSVLNLLEQFLAEGRITVDPSKHAKPVTLHDPCNLVRLGGVLEPQRAVLKQTVTTLVEMSPNREKNFCCGGGGGQLSMTRYADRRITAGGMKAEQIKATEAKVVVAPCHNCIDQLSELNKLHKLGVDIKTVTEMVADALVLPEPSTATSGDGRSQ